MNQTSAHQIDWGGFKLMTDHSSNISNKQFVQHKVPSTRSLQIPNYADCNFLISFFDPVKYMWCTRNNTQPKKQFRNSLSLPKLGVGMRGKCSYSGARNTCFKSINSYRGAIFLSSKRENFYRQLIKLGVVELVTTQVEVC